MKAWSVVTLSTLAFLLGAGLGYLISYRFIIAPLQIQLDTIRDQADKTITTLKEIEKITEAKVEDFIKDITDADDADVIDKYLSDELRERLKRLLE